VSIDSRLERFVIAELAFRDRRAWERAGSPERARVLAERLYGGRGELLGHLHRVAAAFPSRFRPVAWLHHAHEDAVPSRALTAAGLTNAEVRAVRLLAHVDLATSGHVKLNRIRAIAKAPGSSGRLARAVARTELGDTLVGTCTTQERPTALGLLGDSGVSG
jgi:hypothetical protein